LSRLPDKYRVVIVLCDLEGKTRKEAARQLGCPEGTVAGQLARARAMLAKRLTQRGVTLSGGVLAAVLSQQAVSAGVPSSVEDSTIKAATLLAAGKAAATGAISVKVAALTEGVLKAMLMSKLEAVVAAVLILGFMATGATVLTFRTSAAHGHQPPAAEKRPQKGKEEGKRERPQKGPTVWGKAVGGVQAGLGYLIVPKRPHAIGDTVTLSVRVRNVGNQDVKFSFFNVHFLTNPPTVRDGEGTLVIIRSERSGGVPALTEVKLEPGREIQLCQMNLELRPASEKGKRQLWTLYGTGKFQLHYRDVSGHMGGVFERDPDPVLSKLATGKLELEIKPDRPAEKK